MTNLAISAMHFETYFSFDRIQDLCQVLLLLCSEIRTQLAWIATALYTANIYST